LVGSPLFSFLPSRFEKGFRRVQFLEDVRQKAGEFAKENATLMLTAGGVVGTVATAVLTGRAGFKAAQIIEAEKAKRFVDVAVEKTDPTTDEVQAEITFSTKDKVMVVWPQFVPPVITGTATVAAIIMSHRMSSAKIAGLAAAYGLAERNFSEYKEKVAERITGPKKKAIEDELAQDAVDRTPGGDKVVVVEGEVLCLDKPSGRYFHSTMETIRQAVNTTNAEVFNHGFALLSFFYTELGLEETTWSEEVGFNAENLLELTFTTATAPGNRPCLVFDFVRLPKADYDPKHY